VKVVFADSFFFLAALNPADTRHARAIAWSTAYQGDLVTTAWVITEVADAFVKPRHRRVFREFYKALLVDPRVKIISPEPSLWQRGLELFFDRPDKEWSLTDCISFAVMRDKNITQALTGDRHFQQAGFVALL
jgi:uncharacterized protein